MKKSIAYSIGEHEISMQTRVANVLEYARAIYGGEGISGVANYSESIRSVTADQVKKAAQTYLDPALLRTAIVRGKEK
jgi:predicted Zn-dependent peptidase